MSQGAGGLNYGVVPAGRRAPAGYAGGLDYGVARRARPSPAGYAGEADTRVAPPAPPPRPARRAVTPPRPADPDLSPRRPARRSVRPGPPPSAPAAAPDVAFDAAAAVPAGPAAAGPAATPVPAHTETQTPAPVVRVPAVRVPVVRPGARMLLGLVWGALLLVAVEYSAVVTVLLLVPVGVIAAVSGLRAAGAAGSSGEHRVKGSARLSPAMVVAIAAPVVLPLAALAGPVPAVVVTVVALATGGLVLANAGEGPPLLVAVAVFAPSIAAMSMVLARGQSVSEALDLVAAVCVYDVVCFVGGDGRSPLGGPFGVLVGMIGVAILSVFVAATMDPPFSGIRPWMMFGLVAVAAPAGVALTGLIGRGSRLPALRRIDSLFLAGPAWVITVALVLHR